MRTISGSTLYFLKIRLFLSTSRSLVYLFELIRRSFDIARNEVGIASNLKLEFPGLCKPVTPWKHDLCGTQKLINLRV